LEHSAVWTGDRMLIWGGSAAGSMPGVTLYADGASYDPISDSWTPLNPMTPLAGRTRQSAIWTGAEMIIWGGSSSDCPGQSQTCGDGAEYNPLSDSWNLLSAVNAPTARSFHSAVWTGAQ